MVNKKVVEKRKFVRAKHMLGVQFRIIQSGSKKTQGKWNLGTTENMSADGILFLTETSCSIGDIIEVQVTMSGVLNVCYGKAKVIRVDQKRASKLTKIAAQLIQKRKAAVRKTVPTPRTAKKETKKKTSTSKKVVTKKKPSARKTTLSKKKVVKKKTSKRK